MGPEVCCECADRFKTDKRLVKEIFVDETLLQIDGQNYWLWIAYEPNLNICLTMHLSRESPFSQTVLTGIMMLADG